MRCGAARRGSWAALVLGAFVRFDDARGASEAYAAEHDAALLVGEHDFSSFRSAQCQAKSPVKSMDRIAIEADGMARDRDGTLWYATAAGLYRLDATGRPAVRIEPAPVAAASPAAATPSGTFTIRKPSCFPCIQ